MRIVPAFLSVSVKRFLHLLELRGRLNEVRGCMRPVSLLSRRKLRLRRDDLGTESLNLRNRADTRESATFAPMSSAGMLPQKLHVGLQRMRWFFASPTWTLSSLSFSTVMF